MKTTLILIMFLVPRVVCFGQKQNIIINTDVLAYPFGFNPNIGIEKCFSKYSFTLNGMWRRRTWHDINSFFGKFYPTKGYRIDFITKFFPYGKDSKPKGFYLSVLIRKDYAYIPKIYYKFDNYTVSEKENEFEIGLLMGYQHFISQKIMLDYSFGWGYEWYEYFDKLITGNGPERLFKNSDSFSIKGSGFAEWPYFTIKIGYYFDRKIKPAANKRS